MSFEPGQQIRHKPSGEVVEFRRVSRKHRGVVKIETSGPWGPLDVQLFEAVQEGEVSSSLHYEHKGGGFYDILDGDKVVDTVRGKTAAEARIS